MNIVQIHRKIKSRLDQVNTPRFKTWQIDNSVNTGINNLLRYKVAGVIENGKRVSFQKTKMIRDELYTIVKSRGTIGTMFISSTSGNFEVGNTITASLSGATGIIITVVDTGGSTRLITFRYTSTNVFTPAPTEYISSDAGVPGSGTLLVNSQNNVNTIQIDGDVIKRLPGSESIDPDVYRYLLILKIKVNDQVEDFCIPITYDDVPMLEKNPYMRPDQDYPAKFYYVESSVGLTCFYGKVGDDYISESEISYIAQPAIVDYGDQITSTSADVPEDTEAIAVTTTVYDNGSGAQTYQPGEEFLMYPGGSGQAKITSGTAVINFVNTDMPIALQEEIITEAATILNLDVENYNKWKAMEESDQLDKK